MVEIIRPVNSIEFANAIAKAYNLYAQYLDNIHNEMVKKNENHISTSITRCKLLSY